MVKVTIPPKFGLIPSVLSHRNVNLRNDHRIPEFREMLEFVPATPTEYLQRWIMANTVFGDDVELASVIRWADDQVSFCITQSHYDGEPASTRDIEEYFIAANWTKIRDPEGQHQLFFNYAFNVLAIDALPRNCYVNRAGLQPFDVILCEPNSELESYLRLFE